MGLESESSFSHHRLIESEADFEYRCNRILPGKWQEKMTSFQRKN